MKTTIIGNAEIYSEGECRERGYVVVNEKGDIEEVGSGDAPAIEGAEKVDAAGMWLLPGVIDAHVHCRQPGGEHKGDIATETRAAVLGGVTTVFDMPNTAPATTTAKAWQTKTATAKATAQTNYAAWLGATPGNLEELTKADYGLIPGIKVYMGSTTGSLLLDGGDALDALFAHAPALIAVHAEDNALIARASEDVRKRYSGSTCIPVTEHPRIRPAEACAAAVKRAVELAVRHGARLHVCHVSSRAELDLIAGARNAAKITAEACVGHLWWCDEDFPILGSRIKCNPSIKSRDDRDALRSAVFGDGIDTVVTDHAPHLLGEKVGGAFSAPSGFPTLQYSLPMMLTIAREAGAGPMAAVRKMCHAPADCFNVRRRGYIRKGFRADLVLVDPHGETRVTDYSAAGRCGWSPLAGTTLPFRVVRTWVNGREPSPGGGEAIEFDRR